MPTTTMPTTPTIITDRRVTGNSTAVSCATNQDAKLQNSLDSNRGLQALLRSLVLCSDNSTIKTLVHKTIHDWVQLSTLTCRVTLLRNACLVSLQAYRFSGVLPMHLVFIGAICVVRFNVLSASQQYESMQSVVLFEK